MTVLYDPVPVPLWKGYVDALDSDIADIKDDPDGWAQAGLGDRSPVRPAIHAVRPGRTSTSSPGIRRMTFWGGPSGGGSRRCAPSIG